MSRLTCLLCAVALAVPLAAADTDEKKDDKKKTEQKADPKPTNASDYVPAGEISGVLARGAGKNENSIALRGTRLAVQGANRGRPSLRAVEDDHVYELTPDVKIRFMHPPPKTDEKGKNIPYTDKELRELKGDPNLKGYKADLEDLKPGKMVTLHLVRIKGAKGELAEKRLADRVYITGDAPMLSAPEKPGERKKDK